MIILCKTFFYLLLMCLSSFLCGIVFNNLNEMNQQTNIEENEQLRELKNHSFNCIRICILGAISSSLLLINVFVDNNFLIVGHNICMMVVFAMFAISENKQENSRFNIILQYIVLEIFLFTSTIIKLIGGIMS